MAQRTLWTEEEVEILKRDWMLKTSKEIGVSIGKTGNAVIGMAHRLNLPIKGTSNTMGVRKPKLAYKKRTPPKPRRPQPVELSTGPIPLIEATSAQCKAVVDGIKDENGLAMVCGKPIVEGKAFSFCSEHFKRFTTTSNRGVSYVRSYPINK